ncbi:MAG TPA: pyridoxal phosphate-dependent aminotransferase [Acidobacteriota bacterium]|nr:pyridoxal phosphate-dependent aminotransferase [Acidobacteriota bacterium]
MTVARTIADQLSRSSWIRKMFEEGARLKAERGAENVFDFSLGNPEIEPPPCVLEAARRALDDPRPGRHAYMPNAGFPAVRQRLAERLAAASGVPFEGRNIVMTVGAGGALNVLFKAILDPGDEVIVLAPYFVEYGFYVGNHGGKLVVVDTTRDFLPDVEKIRAAVTPRTKAILVNSPNNPTGVIYSAETFRALDALIKSLDHDVLLVSDEPYKALVFDDAKPPEVPAYVDNVVVATSWSKTLALPGERIGYLAVSPRIADADKLVDACTFAIRVLGFVNAPAIWQWVAAEVGDQSIDVAPYREKSGILYRGLTEIGYRCVRPQGAFYLFPETPIADDVAFVRMLVDEGVLTVPGTGFGRPGHMRLSITVPKKTVEGALPGLERAFRRARG